MCKSIEVDQLHFDFNISRIHPLKECACKWKFYLEFFLWHAMEIHLLQGSISFPLFEKWKASYFFTYFGILIGSIAILSSIKNEGTPFVNIIETRGLPIEKGSLISSVTLRSFPSHLPRDFDSY